MNTTEAHWEQRSGVTACELNFGDGQTLSADLDVSAGGLGAPSPHDLLDAALAACTTLTLQLYIARKKMQVSHVRVAVSHETEDGRNHMVRTIHLVGQLNETERAGLLRVAEACPVHKVLVGGAKVSTLADFQASA